MKSDVVMEISDVVMELYNNSITTSIIIITIFMITIFIV